MNNFDIDGVKSLLEKVKLINFKYEKILKSDENDFNIFSILKKEHDEKYLHSRFIYEILNPSGIHNKGDIFLRSFLETVGISDFAKEDISVEREYKKIDICITNSRKQAIIIENKIDAEDQDRQLQRYYETMEENGFDDIKVIYLTLSGYEPSPQSMGSLEKNKDELILTVSYNTDIDNWLEKCIKEAATFPILRETFVQYRILIQKLTGQYHTKGYIMEIKELLMNEKNIRLATDISQALTEAQTEIKSKFWEEFLSCLRKKYDIEEDNFDIAINLLDIEDDEKLKFCVQIYERKNQYGFFVDRNGSYIINNEPKYDRLSDFIKDTIDSDFFRNDSWLACKYPNRNFNFEDFNDDNVFALADAAKREKYVKELTDQ